MVLALVAAGWAFDLEGPGRWVEGERVAVADAEILLDQGLLFPVRDAAGLAGFAFVGQVSLDVPVPDPGDALVVRANVPDAPVADGRWVEGGEVLVAFGRDPELAAAAELGHALIDSEGVMWREPSGDERIVVTGLAPRFALLRAQDAVRARARKLGLLGIGPVEMLAREALRDGAPRRIVELRAEHDLGSLVDVVHPDADDTHTWLTFVVDPSGLADDTYAEVVGVHGPIEGDRVWRAVGGVPHAARTGPQVVRAVENVVVTTGPGVALDAALTADLRLEALETTSLVDVWLPRPPPLVYNGVLSMARDPQLEATVAGVAGEVVDVPWGLRTPRDAVLRTVLLPEPVGPGAPRRLELRWLDRFDVGGRINPAEFVSSAATCSPAPRGTDAGGTWSNQPTGAKNPLDQWNFTLGAASAGQPVVPRLPTAREDFPVEFRLGADAGPRYQPVAGRVVERIEQEGGVVLRTAGTARTSFAVGDYTEAGASSLAGLPAIRVYRHGPLDEDLMVAVRGILHFYAPAFGPWPHGEITIVQDQHRPVITGAVAAILPQADPDSVRPEVRYAGEGQLVLRGLKSVAAQCDQDEPMPLVSADGVESHRFLPGGQKMPDELVRSLAHALAQAWFPPESWSERDRWFPEAVAGLLRDEFVEEGFGRKRAAHWASEADYQARMRDVVRPGPIAGRTDDWAVERGARLLHAALARVGEPALHRSLARLRTGPDASVDAFVRILEEETGVRWAGTFEVFATAGLMPEVVAERVGTTLTITADPPFGEWELPVDVAGEIRWVRIVNGSGTLEVPERAALAVDPESWLPLRRVRLDDAS